MNRDDDSTMQNVFQMSMQHPKNAGQPTTNFSAPVNTMQFRNVKGNRRVRKYRLNYKKN